MIGFAAEPMSEADTKSFEQLVRFEVWHNRRLLQRIAAEQYPKIPLIDLMLTVDYSQVPRQIRVRPLEEAREDPRGVLDLMERAGLVRWIDGTQERDENIREAKRKEDTILEAIFMEGQTKVFYRVCSESFWWKGNWMECNLDIDTPESENARIAILLLNCGQTDDSITTNFDNVGCIYMLKYYVS